MLAGEKIPGAKAARNPLPPKLAALLRESRVAAGTPEQRDLWHNGWSFVGLVALLGAEWMLRRRAGVS